MITLLPGNICKQVYGTNCACAIYYTTPFEELSQRWQTGGNTKYDLTGRRFERFRPINKLTGRNMSLAI